MPDSSTISVPRRAAQLLIHPADQLLAGRLVGPGRLAEEDLGHADLRRIAVDLQGDGFGRLGALGIQEQAAEIGLGPLAAALGARGHRRATG